MKIKINFEGGFSLVELLVSTTICFIIVVSLIGVGKLFQDHFTSSNNDIKLERSVYLAMDSMIREIREAKEVSCEDKKLEITNNDDETIEFEIVGSTLTRDGVIIAEYINNGASKFESEDKTVTIELVGEFEGREVKLINSVTLRN